MEQVLKLCTETSKRVDSHSEAIKELRLDVKELQAKDTSLSVQQSMMSVTLNNIADTLKEFKSNTADGLTDLKRDNARMIDALNERVAAIANQPAKRWNYLVQTVIGTIAGSVVTALTAIQMLK